MKHFFTTRLLACLAVLLGLWPSLAMAAPFTPGNLVVVRIGDGSAALTSAATATFLLEYTPAGVLVQTIALPTATAGTNSILTNTGSSSSDAVLTRSADGAYLVLTGYDAAPGVLAVSGTASTANNRVIGRIAADGTFDTSTRISDAFSTGNIRSAATADGTSFYAIGSKDGVRYLPLGNPAATATTALNTASPTNLRSVGIYGGNLYISSATGAFLGLSQVGTGLPTSGTQTITALPGFPTTASSPAQSPYAFYMADLSSAVAGVDVAYVTDERTSTDGGIQKWSLVGGTWVLNGTITSAVGTTAGQAVRGVNGSVSGTTVSLAASGNGGLYLLTDNAGYNATPSTLLLPSPIATAGTNATFRGVAFAPVAAAAAPTITSFTPATGAAGTTVTITGTNLTGATIVTLNGVAITGFTVVNGTTITFTVPATATTGTIAVTTPGGTVTSTGTFTFVPAAAAPTVTSFTPASGPVGTTVTVTGTNFTGATGATLNGTAVTGFTVVSATSVTFTVPAGATSGVIAVTTAAGTGTSATSFTVTAAAPTIASFTPTTGAAGVTVTLTGTNFTGATVVTVGGINVTGFTVVNATTITFVLPATAVTGPIVVTTPGGTATSTTSFTVTAAAVPTITTLSPARAVVGGPAFVLTVGGTNLTATTQVNFRGQNYTAASVIGTTSITVNIPASAIATLGQFTVTVNNGGTASNTLDFAVVAAATTVAYEDFEQGVRTGYTDAVPVALRSGAWTFTQALLGDLFNDRVNQAKSARIRGGGSIAMNFDKPNGAGIVTISAGLYGTDTGPTFTAEVSTDGGATYQFIAGTPTALTNTLTPYALTVNRSGNVRLRFNTTNTTSGANPRINLDDLTITNFTGTATAASQALPGLSVFPNPATDRITVALPSAGAATVALRDLTGRMVLAPATLGADKQLALPATLARGIYLLEVKQGDVLAVRRIEKN